jgi:hypothetical protein
MMLQYQNRIYTPPWSVASWRNENIRAYLWKSSGAAIFKCVLLGLICFCFDAFIKLHDFFVYYIKFTKP